MSKPALSARMAASRQAISWAPMSASVISAGVIQPSVKGMALGASVGHGASPRARSASPTGPPPCQGRWVEAFRPAWASWIAGAAPLALRKSATLPRARACSSFQMPTSPWLIRPSAVTPVASTNTAPAPPRAKRPRWTRCQSCTTPSTAAYWHIGEMTTRLRRVTSPMVMGVNSLGAVKAASWRGRPTWGLADAGQADGSKNPQRRSGKAASAAVRSIVCRSMHWLAAILEIVPQSASSSERQSASR